MSDKEYTSYQKAALRRGSAPQPPDSPQARLEASLYEGDRRHAATGIVWGIAAVLAASAIANAVLPFVPGLL